MQTSCKFNTAVNIDSTSKVGLSNGNNIENQNQSLNFSSSILCEVKSNETHCVEGDSTTNTLETSQQLASEVNEIASLILKMSDTPALPETNERPQFNQVATICILSDHSSEPGESNLPTLMWERLSHKDLSFVQRNPKQIAVTNLNMQNLKIKQSNAQFSEISSNLAANLAHMSSADDASYTQNVSGSTSVTSKYSETKTFSHVLKFHEAMWKQQVSNRIVETLALGKQDLELVIAPKSLGKIALHVSSSGDTLILTIAADNLKTASLLSAALPEIEDNLKDSGIGVLSTKLGSNGAHAEQEQNNEKSDAEPSTRLHGQSAKSEDEEGVQEIGTMSYHTGKYSYEV